MFDMTGALDLPASGQVTVAGVSLGDLSSRELASSDRILWIKDGRKDRLERREDIHIRVGQVH